MFCFWSPWCCLNNKTNPNLCFKVPTINQALVHIYIHTYIHTWRLQDAIKTPYVAWIINPVISHFTYWGHKHNNKNVYKNKTKQTLKITQISPVRIENPPWANQESLSRDPTKSDKILLCYPIVSPPPFFSPNQTLSCSCALILHRLSLYPVPQRPSHPTDTSHCCKWCGRSLAGRWCHTCRWVAEEVLCRLYCRAWARVQLCELLAIGLAGASRSQSTCTKDRPVTRLRKLRRVWTRILWLKNLGWILTLPKANLTKSWSVRQNLKVWPLKSNLLMRTF